MAVTSSEVIASIDGATWTEVPLPEGVYGSFESVAASPARLVLVGDAGRIVTLPLP